MLAAPFVVTFKKFQEDCTMYLKFSICQIFPSRIRLQYEDEEVSTFINLDSPIQLDQSKPNRINVLAEETRETDSM